MQESRFCFTIIHALSLHIVIIMDEQGNPLILYIKKTTTELLKGEIFPASPMRSMGKVVQV